MNNVRVNTVKQVTRLINKTKGKRYVCFKPIMVTMINDLFIYSVLITVNRPPTHFSTKLLHSESSKLHTPTTNPLSDATSNLSNVTGKTTCGVP